MSTDTHPTDTHPADVAPTGGPQADRRRPVVIATAVAIAVLLLAAVLALTGGPDTDLAADPAIEPVAEPASGETLELSLGEGGALASCLPVDAAILADMSPAFAATATAVDGETVTLAVDRWYAGGDADTVVLTAPAGLEALIGGFDLQVGERYLITAAQGTVNYCGYSGPATPELQALFDEAFPA